MRFRADALRRNYLVWGCATLLVCSTASLLWSDDNSETESAQNSPTREEQIADAVKRNGPIFSDWPKPELAIVISGEMDGYLEPCGCAGLDNQKGGLKRRHTFFKQLTDKGWPIIPLDMGGLVRRVGPQSEMKYRFALQSLIKHDYETIGFGVRELLLSTDALIFAIANLEPDTNPLVSANVDLFSTDSGFSKKYHIVEKGGKRIGVTSVLGKQHQAKLKNAEGIMLQDPEKALEKIVPKLEKEECDLLILLVHSDPEEARELARKYPQFQFVATTGGAEEPPNRMYPIQGSQAQLIEAGHKGMYVMVLGIFDDAEQPYRIQRVPLDHRFDDSEDMQKMLIAYQDELKTTGLEGLGVTGVKHSTDGFVGTEACADCHSSAMEAFENTPHAHATKTLVELDPPRHFDPECLSCHATGWEPQKYFPYASGYLGLKKTPHLLDNGCENCHGPGQAHVAAESGETEANEAQLEKLRARMRLKIVENEGNKDGQVFEKGVVAKMCMKCHDLDNSPEFDFQEYWPEVEHYGKD